MARISTTPPRVGIWWDDGRTLVAFSHPPGTPCEITGISDSDLTHAASWPTTANRFRRRPEDEYYAIPRGRVVWVPRAETSLIYHGNGTTPERLALIANEFRLARWKAVTDLHYMVGPACDLLFDEDFD